METNDFLHFFLHLITSYAIVLTFKDILKFFHRKGKAIIFAAIIALIFGFIKEFIVDDYSTNFELFADFLGTFIGMGFCLFV